MQGNTAALLALMTISTLACSSGNPTWQEQTTTNHPRQHVMVQFTDFSLHPSTAQVLQGGTVSWANYASLYTGSIVFSDAVAAAFTCTDLRPNWAKTDTGYQSIPIPMGGASNDLQIPCPLKPGEYDYELWLFTDPRGEYAAMDDPQVQVPGKIIVK